MSFHASSLVYSLFLEIMYDLESKINAAVFPVSFFRFENHHFLTKGIQGGPHNHSIAALGVALKQVVELGRWE